jgi:DNA-directed RNA polymerase specialized sigma24 family protein
MPEPDDRAPAPHLSQIETRWTEVLLAHRGYGTEAAAAQAALLERYGGAVRRYLLGATGDPGLAEELAQEFALRFLRGDFHRADPGRGRFRDFLKRSVRNLLHDYRRRERARPRGRSQAEPAVSGGEFWNIEWEFRDSWCQELLAHTWAGMADLEARTGRPLHALLRYRAEHPEARSQDLAAWLTGLGRKPVSPGRVRQLVLEARAAFADRLVAEVARSLTDPTAEQVEEELIELGLLERCREALARWRADRGGP